MPDEEILPHENLLITNNIQRSTYHGNVMRKQPRTSEKLAFPPSNSAFITMKRFSDVVKSCFATNIGSFINSKRPFIEQGYHVSTNSMLFVATF